MRLPLLRAVSCMRLFFSSQALSSDEFVRGRLNRQRQVLEHAFEKNPFAVVNLVAEGGADPLQNELRCAVERNGEAVALKEAPRDDAREGVARAGIVGGKIRAGDLPGTAVRSAPCNDRGEIGLTLNRNAGNDDGVGTGFVSSVMAAFSSSSVHSGRKGSPKSAKSSVRLGVSTSARAASVLISRTISSVILL